MKQGSFRAVRHVVFLLVMLSLTGFSVFADENTVDYLSVVMESFSGSTAHEWSFGGRTYSYDFDWALDASKFATKTNSDNYPKMSYVEAWPVQLFGANRDKLDLKSLGIWGKFDRRGYNWIDVYPVVPGSAQNGEGPEPYEIPMPGRINYIDLWVWGSNLNYYLEAYVRDYNGIIHSLYMGDLAHAGWKNFRVQIPIHIRQSKRILPHLAGLHFVKFRVWTTPVERVDNFYIYFNQMKVLTDTFETHYDGNELGDPERVQELWASN
ncbi:MAG: flagellar filament outer layer protein FlaA [Treponema sp.]|jgi:hypothetical protein|nr:flagellar filament outer layer protein FlaA [Treponema sp.]